MIRKESSSKGVSISNKACYGSYRLSPILVHFVPHPPNTPPPDEPTMHESLLTIPTGITDFSKDATIVCDGERDDSV